MRPYVSRAAFAFIFFMFALVGTTAAGAQEGGKSRITIASGVRVRAAPQTGAEEVKRLPLGVVVRELERSPSKEKIGAAEDYWFRVAAPGGVEGWVFGGLTAPFDAGRRGETYRQIASARLANAEAPYGELADLVSFLERAVGEGLGRETLAELELARLVALGRSLASVAMEDLEKSPYREWVKAHEGEIVYSEPAGQWFVRAELFWDLQRKFQDVPAAAERIAWEGSQAPLPGECEGYLPCYLYALTESEGRYLKLYPRGAHAGEALQAVANFLDAVVKDLGEANPVFHVPQEDRADFKKKVAELRAQVEPARHALRARVLSQLDEVQKRFR